MRPTPRPPHRGAALLVAMVLLSVVATLAAGMVWLQWRAVEVETAERGRVQNAWLLRGALDYGRLILREDARSSNSTHLGSPWATPLQETKVSAMLAMDRDQSADAGPEAFISGEIADAQARWNLRGLVSNGELVQAQVAVLDKLCTQAGLPAGTATELAAQYLAASLGQADTAPLMPQTIDDLGWLGLAPALLQRLRPWVVLLPEPTPINLNTAPREVLASVLPGLDLGSADRLVQARSRQPFKSAQDAATAVGVSSAWPATLADVRSAYFEVQGRVRLDERWLTERYLVQRRDLQVRPIHRLRSAAVGEPGP